MPEQALQRLLAGNRRYVADRPTLDESPGRRVAVAAGQHPFAAVLSCVDSRVPPELIFDQGLGDLFVIRTAGQVLDRAVLGSLEFGVAELGIALIVVLGHTQCGAVRATMAALDRNAAAPADMEFLVEAMAPAVEVARQVGGNLWDNAVRAQISLVVERLRHAPILHKAVAQGRLKVVGAYYDLESGLVEVMEG
ncbi:MAG: hypothetical protein AUJ55_13295 [Proteobacteria bacterium CG1_02_64_396]|nr:MAG: hypothetical protein AUJ55_13295 [Proteobacteria bacterium CG1_02_64_396]